MGTPAPPGKQCSSCARYRGLVDIDPQPGLEGDYVPACQAYPNGIPDALLFDRADHTRPFTGDNGLLYQPTGN